MISKWCEYGEGFFFYGMEQYTKPFKSLQEQAELLISRGLVGEKREICERLQHVGYYRLSAYWYPFRIPVDSAHRKSELSPRHNPYKGLEPLSIWQKTAPFVAWCHWADRSRSSGSNRIQIRRILRAFRIWNLVAGKCDWKDKNQCFTKKAIWFCHSFCWEIQWRLLAGLDGCRGNGFRWFIIFSEFIGKRYSEKNCQWSWHSYRTVTLVDRSTSSYPECLRASCTCMEQNVGNFSQEAQGMGWVYLW